MRKRQKKRSPIGYKGAKTIEEEWALLVREVHDDVSDVSEINPATLARLSSEREQLPNPEVRAHVSIALMKLRQTNTA